MQLKNYNLLFFLLSFLPMFLIGQERDLNYLQEDEQVTINLNKHDFESRSRFLSSHIFNYIATSFVEYDNQSGNESYRGSFLDFSISIELKNGLSWEIFNPPKRPSFFFFKILFRSKNQKFINRLDYETFMGVWETRGVLPFEVIERFIVCRNFYTMDKEILIAIEKYELIPGLDEKLIIRTIENH